MRKTAFDIALRCLTLLLLAACLSAGSVLAQGGVSGVVVNDSANIRITPAFGADMLGNVPSGWAFTADARSPDNEWLRVDFNGQEGWLHTATVTILGGDINALPVADPRTIPYGGFESPRAGMSGASSPVTAKLISGLRLRAGPSTGYPVLANPPRNSIVPVLGRTANSAWVQINFEGTLGWVVTQYLEFGPGFELAALPVDGIVADSLPISQPTRNDYIATLKLMLARIDLAQPSLDAIRASWTDAALNGRAFCHSYPPRPSDFNVPNPLLAAFYPTLNPVLTTFNDAMFNVRKAIDLFIEVCNQPGTGNPVGLAAVEGALGVVNLADGQFADLRRKLAELIPPDIQPGANECLLTYQGENDILPIIQKDIVYFASFDPKTFVIGACFDAAVGENYLFQTLRLDGNVVAFLSASPLDNPTSFIAVGKDSPGSTVALRIGPVLITQAGRYLLIISNAGGEGVGTGRIAYTISNITGLTVSPQLQIDPNTGQAVLGAPTQITGGTTTTIATATPGAVSVVCPSLAFTCNQLFSCDEARACLAAGNFSLDPDSDGIPCEENLCR